MSHCLAEEPMTRWRHKFFQWHPMGLYVQLRFCVWQHKPPGPSFKQAFVSRIASDGTVSLENPHELLLKVCASIPTGR